VLRVSEALDLHGDAQERYEQACERAVLARAEWVSAGSPFTIVHANKAMGVHPAYQALLLSERHVELLARPLRSSRWFVPKPAAEVDRLTELSPAARLRVVTASNPASRR
jgi:hypothetical protein